MNADLYRHFMIEYFEDLNKKTFEQNLDKHLTLNLDRSLEEGDIPNSVIHLNLYGFNQTLKEGDIPNSVTHLTFNCFNHPLKEDVISNSVTH